MFNVAMILVVINATLVEAGKAWKIIIDPHNDQLSVGLTSTGKQRETNTRKKLSKSNHLIMSLFTLFHFVASMEIWTSIRV